MRKTNSLRDDGGPARLDPWNPGDGKTMLPAISLTGGLLFYGGTCAAANAPLAGARERWGWRCIGYGAALLAAGTVVRWLAA